MYNQEEYIRLLKEVLGAIEEWPDLEFYEKFLDRHWQLIEEIEDVVAREG